FGNFSSTYDRRRCCCKISLTWITSTAASLMPERLRSLAGPAARNVVSRKTVMRALSSGTLGSPTLVRLFRQPLTLLVSDGASNRLSHTSERIRMSITGFLFLRCEEFVPGGKIKSEIPAGCATQTRAAGSHVLQSFIIGVAQANPSCLVIYSVSREPEH